MGLLNLAMRRPIGVLVVVAAIAIAAGLALERMPVDIFPNLNLPVIEVAQTYGGMAPAQMEGYLTSYYEYHFLYISGIEHVESRSIQNVSLIKLYFHPGTDMSQALAQTISYVERARAFMPQGTVAPFVMRFDAGSVPVGQLVFSSDTRGVTEIQDLALFRVRPMFATLPGVSAPPPFGANQRTVVIRVDPDRLRAFGMSPEEVIDAVASGNTVLPAGNVRTGDLNRLAPINSVVSNIQDLATLPLRKGAGPTVYLRDVGTVENGADVLSGYALVNGRRTVYIPVTKRAEASTVDVVNRVKTALPDMQALLPADIKVSFEFDQSVIVRNALHGLLAEGALGAVLTGLMVLLFLADLRSAVIVVTSIPFALLSAVVALWLTGQTVNIMTLGGLALAIGILVDEASVAIENIHTHLARGERTRKAVYDACRETVTPRFLAMLAILAVFIPSLFMVGIPRSLFVPLSLAVGFSMLASYLLSSTLVPILATWMLSPHAQDPDRGLMGLARKTHAGLLRMLLPLAWLIVPAYVIACVAGLVAIGGRLGTDIFPAIDTGQFQIRLRSPAGTRVERTELVALKALEAIRAEASPCKVAISLGFVGTQPQSYPINTMYLWTSGPHEAVLLVALARHARPHLAEFRERLRRRFARDLPGVEVSFEAGDVVTQVMNFGAPAPIEVAASGPNLAANRAFAARLMEKLRRVPCLRDLQYGQPLDYPTVDVQVDRARAGQLGVTVQQVGRALLAATSSSRLVQPDFWADPATGVGYQVQVEVPQSRIASREDVENIPLSGAGAGPWTGTKVGTSANGSPRGFRVGDVAGVRFGTTVGEYDRFNMQRMVTITANVEGCDLGGAAAGAAKAIKSAGEPPKGVRVNLGGQVVPMRQTISGLAGGLWIAAGSIFLLLVANFQSVRVALAALSTVPAVLLGVVAALWLTGTTINVESYMGAIMAVGVSSANAILLVTLAQATRQEGSKVVDAAIDGATRRLRPILMTSLAMIAGMTPMALALGEGGEQTAPLGRAVIGGLSASTLAVLIVLPLVFALLQGRTKVGNPSLHPDDEAEGHSPAAPGGTA